MDLIGVHDLMNDSKDSIAEEIMQRFEQGEKLPAMAFDIVFEHLNYFQKINEDIVILEKLMNAEKQNKLPKLKAIEHYEFHLDNNKDAIFEALYLTKINSFFLQFVCCCSLLQT